MFHFYDIESLQNVFTLCNWKSNENHVDAYYLCDDDALTGAADFETAASQKIKEVNKGFTGTVSFRNLKEKEQSQHLAKVFGLSSAYMVNDPDAKSDYPKSLRPVCDTDPEYDPEKHPYLLGYNSYNYDTTMLTYFLYETFNLRQRIIDAKEKTVCVFKCPTAATMRQYNDILFYEFKSDMPKALIDVNGEKDYNTIQNRIRKNMLLSGRYIDVARLNETQSKVSLKRLLGYLGHQIKESSKIKGKTELKTPEEFYDLLAYNCSDIFGLEKLFQHPFYQGRFTLKREMIKNYPELIYEKKPNEYAPDIDPKKVKKFRMTIDSTSPQIAIESLCPYGHLTDYPAVSFLYPSANKAKELGIKQINVLDESMKFFQKHFGDKPHIIAEFQPIYDYYKAIEGQNFNHSKNYQKDWLGKPEYRSPMKTKDIPYHKSCLYYYDKDGNPTSAFVNFSLGGIHGAEYNKQLFEDEKTEYEQLVKDFNFVKSQFPDPIEAKRAKMILMPNGMTKKATDFLKSGATLKKAEYKDIDSLAPRLFKPGKKGVGQELNDKYVYTSVLLVDHQDFSSYYPTLLRMMEAFYNEGLGYDRYGEVYDKKEEYGVMQYDEKYTENERRLFSVLRDGTKLVMNSITGVADAKFDNKVIMNNKIISMRVIGQLFSWRIGQSQALYGANVVSTNTDGLYSGMDDLDFNRKILKQESKEVNVKIEPHTLFLISKDSNNRIELDRENGKILSASGSTVGCHKGPTPTKALSHPAILDWALCEYLIISGLGYEGLSLHKEINEQIAKNILMASETKFDKIKRLIMFQNINVSSVGSMTYNYATKPDTPNEPIILQHCNRVFLVKQDFPNAVNLKAVTARSITPQTKLKRKRNGERAIQHDFTALKILKEYGVEITDIPDEKEAAIKKITNLEPNWAVHIENRDLHLLEEDEINYLLENLDYEKYLTLLKNAYKTWENQTLDKIKASKTKKKKKLDAEEEFEDVTEEE